MKKSSGPEFVEVFRRLAASDTSAAGQDTSTAKRGISRAGNGRGSYVSGGRVRLDVSYEAVIIFVFVLVGVIMASHIWGYRLGRARRDEVVARPAAVRTPAVTTPRAKRSDSALTPPFWTVRIIDGIRLERAREIRSELRQKGYDAFVTRSGNAFAVNLGRYPKRNDSRAAAMKEKFVKMKYQGGTWFRTAYVRQITNKRSLVE